MRTSCSSMAISRWRCFRTRTLNADVVHTARRGTSRRSLRTGRFSSATAFRTYALPKRRTSCLRKVLWPGICRAPEHRSSRSRVSAMSFTTWRWRIDIDIRSPRRQRQAACPERAEGRFLRRGDFGKKVRRQRFEFRRSSLIRLLEQLEQRAQFAGIRKGDYPVTRGNRGLTQRELPFDLVSPRRLLASQKCCVAAPQNRDD